MLHQAFVDQIRSTLTPNRVVIARITDTLTYKHDKPHAYGTCVIGRSPTCELVLTDPACSRLHCIIYFNNGHLNIRDLDSRVGTVVNGQQLANFRDFPLSKSDTIAVAGERFIIVDVDEKEVKQPLPASAVLTETAIECPFCGGQAYSFAEALNYLQSYVKEVVDKDEQLQRQFLDQRDKMAMIQAELERIYKLHSEHYSNVLRGQRQLKEDADKRQLELQQAKEDEQQQAEELRMSQLSQHDSMKASQTLPKEKKVTINDHDEIIEKKSMFKSFISLFKSKKADEPEAKSVKEHKPTPFVKDVAYEEEEEEQQQEEEHAHSYELPEQQPQEEDQLIEDNAASVKSSKSAEQAEEEPAKEEQLPNQEEANQAQDAEQPPSYHFEAEANTKDEQ